MSRLSPLFAAAACALSCARSGLDQAPADAAPVCAAGAGEPCCASADGGAPTCGGADLVCAGAACTCLAQVTAVYDTVPLVRRVDGTVWVAADRAHFTEVLGPAGHFHATDLAASGSTAYGTAIGCAIVDGGVWCFPLAGPLLDSTDLGAALGPGVMTSTAVRVVTSDAARAPLAGARQLSASMNGGGATFCAVTDAGEIWCWGYGVSGILGRGDSLDASFARPVLAGPGTPFAAAAEVRLGFDSACARKTDGTVWCWGGSALGQIGIADSEGFLPGDVGPTPFPEGPLLLRAPAVRLAANPGNTHCAILDQGTVWCWGWNAYAQTGAGASMLTDRPTPVFSPTGGNLPLTDVIDLAPDRGMQAMCATTAAGALWCWGHPFPPAGTADAIRPDPDPDPARACGRRAAPLAALVVRRARRRGRLRRSERQAHLRRGRPPVRRAASVRRRVHAVARVQSRKTTPRFRSMLNVKVGAAICVSSAATSAKLAARSYIKPPPTPARNGPAPTVSTQTWLRLGPQSLSWDSVTTWRIFPAPTAPET